MADETTTFGPAAHDPDPVPHLVARSAEAARAGDHAVASVLRREAAALEGKAGRPGEAASHHLGACHGFTMAGDAAAARGCLEEARRLVQAAPLAAHLWDVFKQREAQVEHCEATPEHANPKPALRVTPVNLDEFADGTPKEDAARHATPATPVAPAVPADPSVKPVAKPAPKVESPKPGK